MKQTLALTLILLASGCVTTQPTCEDMFTTDNDIAICVLMQKAEEAEARRAWEPGGHLHHGMGGCTPNPMGGCL